MDVRRQRDGAVLTLTIDRPERANGLRAETMDELVAGVEEADADPDLRVVVVRGAGRGFSSGHDLVTGDGAVSTVQDPDALPDWRRLRAITTRWLRIWDSSVPVVAQVHGYCLAGAVELVLACDLCVCATDARFGNPAMRMAGGSPVSLLYPYNASLRAVKEYLWLQEELDGETAVAMGLANRAVPPADLEAEVGRWARRLAAMPPENIALTKAALHRALDAGGFRAGVHGAEFDALAHRTQGTDRWMALVAEVGLRAAVQARDEPFAN